MKEFKYMLPTGFKDYLLNDMDKKNKISVALKRLFLTNGYHLVETPTLEYIDVFTDNNQDEFLYKLINKEGKILALRNDMTKSILRTVLTETKDNCFPQRYCYISNIFRYSREYFGMQHEFTQAGVELIGSDSVFADYEIVRLAVLSLELLLDDYNIYISSSEFFNYYLDDLNISSDIKIEILQQIKKKKIDNIKTLIDKNSYELLSFIIEAIGKRELLQKIKKSVKGERTTKAILRLEKLYDLLEENGLSKNVSFDFSILSFGDYYTGIAIQGYTKGIGTTILSGGRYDNLIDGFNIKKPACGFAININNLIKKAKFTCEKDVTMIFSNDKGRAIKCLSDNSFISLEDTLDEALRYGEFYNIATILDIDNDKQYKLIGGKYICQR